MQYQQSLLTFWAVTKAGKATSMTEDNAFVLIQEVSPRDGLQNQSAILPVHQRIALIKSLVGAGLRRIQIGACVNPKLVPQMADSDLVWKGLDHERRDVLYSMLVLNERGMETAMALGVQRIEIYVSASETHSLRNSRVGTQQALKDAVAIINRGVQAGVTVTAGVMCAFGCFFEGPILEGRVCQMVEILAGSGASEIGLADTTGMGIPNTVKSLVGKVSGIVPVGMISLHLHDTHGQGLANIQAGLDSGIRRFDSSLRGLGGCPFIPGAAGNVATEKVVRLLESLGFRTGVNLDRLEAAVSILTEINNTRICGDQR
jgi:hydroxymethylglutaryl-CoA lyase